MRYLLSTSLAVIAAAAMLPAQLPPGHYLVGTQGWDENSAPDATKNTIQVVSPYTGKATTLNVTGIPKTEFPAAFLISHPATFLVGTKVAAAPAQGNLYRVVLQTNGSWKASKLNTSDLKMNISAMVQDSAFAYVCGSAVFSTGAKDAQIQRIALSNGAVTVHAKFGADFTSSGGAVGSASGMVLIGKTMHVFTFNSAAAETRNQHWTVTTDYPKPTVKKVGNDLPVSKRFKGRGFACTAAVLDPASSNIIVVGRWGEVLWRTPDGKDGRYEQWPGELDFNANYYTELPRNVTINTDTWALAMGDHDDASIDERRGIDQRYPHFPGGPNAPFLNNVCKPNRPSSGVYSVAALEYIPAYDRYLPIADGCKESMSGGAPASYINSTPTPGNKGFAFTLSTMGDMAALAIGLESLGGSPLDLTAFGAPGCKVHVNGIGFFSAYLAYDGVATCPLRVPARAKNVTVYTQWLVPDSRANALGIVLSDARKVVIP